MTTLADIPINEDSTDRQPLISQACHLPVYSPSGDQLSPATGLSYVRPRTRQYKCPNCDCAILPKKPTVEKQKKVVAEVSKILSNVNIPSADQPADTGLSFGKRLKVMISIFRQTIFPLLLSMGELIVALVLLLVELPFFIVFCIRDPLSSTLRKIVFALILTSISISIIDITLILIMKCKKNHHSNLLTLYVKYADILRLICTEILNYPIVICTLVIDGIINGFYLKVTTPLDRYHTAEFYFSLLRLFVKVIVLRILFVFLVIVSIGKSKYQIQKNLFANFCCGFSLEVCFFVHVVGQLFTLVLIYGAIGAKIMCENPNPEEEYIFISVYTWIMILVGFLLSLSGVFTFFISTAGWVRAYPIKFMAIMLEQLEVKEYLPEYPERAKESAKKLLELITKLKDASDNFCLKIVHPFFNLFLSLPSVHYVYLLLAFIAFSLVGEAPLGPDDSKTIMCGYNITETEVIPNENRVTFFIIITVLMNVANLFALIIGFWWLFLLYLGCPLMCFCCIRYCRHDRKHKYLFGCLMTYIIGTMILAIIATFYPMIEIYVVTVFNFHHV